MLTRLCLHRYTHTHACICNCVCLSVCVCLCISSAFRRQLVARSGGNSSGSIDSLACCPFLLPPATPPSTYTSATFFGQGCPSHTLDKLLHGPQQSPVFFQSPGCVFICHTLTTLYCQYTHTDEYSHLCVCVCVVGEGNG